MLVELMVENYRSFEKETRVPLQAVTFLFGPNASGKTALLDALNQVATVISDRGRTFEDRFPTHGAYSLRNQRYDSSQPMRIGLQFRFDHDLGSTTLEYLLSVHESAGQVIGSEVIQLDGRTVHSVQGASSAMSALSLTDMDDQIALEAFRQHVLFMRRYRISPDRVRAKTDRQTKWITPTGDDLPSALDFLFQDPAARAEYITSLQRLFPRIADLSIGVGSSDSWIRFESVTGRKHVGAHLSDGQAVSCAVAFLLQSSRSPAVLLFEEIENGLSPIVMKAILEMMDNAVHSPATPVNQMICTTHSPFVISWADEHALALQISSTGAVRTVRDVLRQFGATQQNPVSYSEACGLLETYWYT